MLFAAGPPFCLMQILLFINAQYVYFLSQLLPKQMRSQTSVHYDDLYSIILSLPTVPLILSFIGFSTPCQVAIDPNISCFGF